MSLMSQLHNFRIFQNVYVFSYLSSELSSFEGVQVDSSRLCTSSKYITCYANYDIICMLHTSICINI